MRIMWEMKDRINDTLETESEFQQRGNGAEQTGETRNRSFSNISDEPAGIVPTIPFLSFRSRLLQRRNICTVPVNYSILKTSSTF